LLDGGQPLYDWWQGSLHQYKYSRSVGMSTGCELPTRGSIRGVMPTPRLTPRPRHTGSCQQGRSRPFPLQAVIGPPFTAGNACGNLLYERAPFTGLLA
jgi:hypothetical protein